MKKTVIIILAGALLCGACSNNLIGSDSESTKSVKDNQVNYSGPTTGQSQPTDCYLFTDSGMIWIPCGYKPKGN